jgi:DNA-binding XRE family transcriptional regulator
MPAKPSRKDSKQRRMRAQEWKLFRKNNLLTQRRLAENLNVSRRTIQQIEGGYINPHAETLRRFTTYRAKYDPPSPIAETA